MANLPLNENYSNTTATSPGPIPTKDFKNILEAISQYSQQPGSGGLAGYRPSTRLRDYKTFANQMPFEYFGKPGTPEREASESIAMRRYGSLINEGQGIQTGQPFYPSDAGPNALSDLPENYGEFAEPMDIEEDGYKLSWGTPSNPKIHNINAGGITGQFVQDIDNRDLLVKTKRQRTDSMNDSIRQGRPGYMYQIDHIMPLSLGGADTESNKQLLTYSQNDKKTRAQAVPYTLYAYGDISLQEARTMAMQWENRDLSDIPQPNDIGFVSDVGKKTGIEIAREAKERWSKPKKVGFKEVMEGVPDAMKNLGEGILPDPAREFIKGFGSQGTLGFLPYEIDDDVSKGSWLGGKLGQISGGVASFMIGAGFIAGAVKGITKAYRVLSGVKAAKAGFGLKAIKTSANAVKAADAVKKTATTTKSGKTFVDTVWKTNASKPPKYIARVLGDSARLNRMGKFAGLSAVIGQGERFVENKFNPYILSGQMMETDQGGAGAVLGNVFKDMALGSLYGAAAPTLKGVGYATALPITMGLLMNPDEPTEAIVDGVAFGVLHAMGVMGEPGFNNIKKFGGNKYVDPVMKKWQETITKASYESVKFHDPSISKYKYNETIPNEKLFNAEQVGIHNIVNTFFTGKGIDAKTRGKIIEDIQKYSRDIGRILDDSAIPELPWSLKFSRSRRKARTTKIKEQQTKIAETFGPEAKTPEIKSAEKYLNEGDLRAMFNEINRLKIGVNELSKNMLSNEMRIKANMDDQLSISEHELRGRFMEQQKLINPPVARRAVDLIDDSFMDRSFLNDKTKTQPEGTYQTGTTAIVGAESGSSAGFDYFMEQKKLGNASPNVIIVKAPYLDWLWRIKNKLTKLDKKAIEDGTKAVDPHPENTLMAYGVIAKKNTKGEIVSKELVNLGYVASKHRIQTGKNAYNKHEAVKKYEKTNGEEGLPPISKNKDDIASGMQRQGIQILIGNLHPSTTQATKIAGKRFGMITFEEKNWTATNELVKRMKKQEADGMVAPEDVTPLSMDIAEYKYTKDPKQKAELVESIKKKMDDSHSASNRIPTTNILPKTKGAKNTLVGREITREGIMTMESAFDVKSPIELKTYFQNQFGMLLDDVTARNFFERRNSITLREGVKTLVDAINRGDTNSATRIRLELMKPYLEGPDILNGIFGDATLDLPIAPKKIKFPETETEPLPKKFEVTKRKATPEELNRKKDSGTERAIRNFEVEGKDAMENIITEKYSSDKKIAQKHQNIISEIEKRAELELDKIKMSQKQIDDIKNDIRTRLESHSEFILQKRPKTMREMAEERSIQKNNEYNEPMYEKETDVPAPEIESDQFYNFINKGIKSKNPIQHIFAKTFDKAFQYMQDTFFEKDISYKENPIFAEFLSTVHPSGEDFWNKRFASDVNEKGREITQKRDIINERAMGEFGQEKAKIKERSKEARKRSLNDEDLILQPNEMIHLMKARGLKEEVVEKGMMVEDPFQMEDMVSGLTRGENMMAGVVSDLPMTARSAFNDARHILIGSGKTGDGLISFINRTITSKDPNAKKVSVSAKIFDKLLKEAIELDKNREITMKKLEKAKEQLPVLKKRLEDLKNPEELSNWQTPEIVESSISDIMKKIKDYSKSIKEGEGGPGYGRGGPGYDGRGGFWSGVGSVLSGVNSGINKAVNKTADWSYKKYSDIANARETGPISKTFGKIADLSYKANNAVADKAYQKYSNLKQSIKSAPGKAVNFLSDKAWQGFNNIKKGINSKKKFTVEAKQEEPEQQPWDSQETVQPWENEKQEVKPVEPVWEAEEIKEEIIPEKKPEIQDDIDLSSPSPFNNRSYNEVIKDIKKFDPISKEWEYYARDFSPENELNEYRKKIIEIFGKELAPTAIAVMMGESHGVPERVGDTNPERLSKDSNGDIIGYSVGLFQNRTGGGSWSRAAEHGISVDEYTNNMLDPEQNIREAKRIFDQNDQSFQPWTAFTGYKNSPPPYLDFIDEAQQFVDNYNYL